MHTEKNHVTYWYSWTNNYKSTFVLWEIQKPIPLLKTVYGCVCLWACVAVCVCVTIRTTPNILTSEDDFQGSVLFFSPCGSLRSGLVANAFPTVALHRLSFISLWRKTYCVNKFGLKVYVLKHPPPQCWDMPEAPCPLLLPFTVTADCSHCNHPVSLWFYYICTKQSFLYLSPSLHKKGHWIRSLGPGSFEWQKAVAGTRHWIWSWRSTWRSLDSLHISLI